MSILNEKLIEVINKNNLNSELKTGNFGIEKENLRVKYDGELSLTPHPEQFGEKLKNLYIKTDFSESQVEMITPTFNSIEETYDFLKNLNNIVSLELDNELLWPQSSPSILVEEEKIPLADFGPRGIEEKKYRETLSKKYGKKNQLISGIHYNFSFSDRFIDALYKSYEGDMSFREFKDQMYLKVTKNLLKHRWLSIYLTGASPVIHNSHDEKVIATMETDDYESYFMKDNVSFRNGKFGYRNKKNYIISFETAKDYVKSIEALIDSGDLSDPREYYSSIRLRAYDNNNLLGSLKDDGINYLEVRHIDLNPFEKEGISLETLYLTHLFMLYSLLCEDEEFGEAEQLVAYKNHELAVGSGLKENLEIYKSSEEKVLLSELGEEILEKIRKVIYVIGEDTDFLNNIIDDAIEKVKNPKKTLAYKVLENTRENNYINFHLKKAKDYLNQSKKEEFKLIGYEDLELSTQILLKTAIKRGIKFEILDRQDNFILLDNGEKKEYIKQATKTSLDNYSTIMIMENKVVTKKVLEKEGVRIPIGRDYDNADLAKKDFEYFKDGKIVVKPKSTNFGIGITIFKEKFTKESYERAIDIAFENDNSVLVEEFISGKEYRFLVLGSQVAGVLNRVPANVLGDGKSNIIQLVQEKNKDFLRGQGYTTPLEKINLGESELMFLNSQNKDFEYIPLKDETVYLRENSNISTGGDSIDYTNRVHKKYNKIAVESAKAVGARICGVDMMIDDLEAEPTEDNYAIIELNFNPAIHIHSYPYIGENRKIADELLNLLNI